jgi:pimeloyl-ACP methyl ester carboxylesterase
MVVFLAGFAGAATSEAQPTGFLRESLLGTFDAMIRARAIPPMSLLLPNCLTSLGGSQYVNSAATGRYADYLLDELVPWAIERTRASSVGVMGQSSGGFGALHLAMERPGVFDAVGVSAGDMAFDLTFQPEFPKAVRAFRSLGGPEELLRKLAADPSIAGSPTHPVSAALLLLAMGACYSPVGSDGGFEMPFDLETAELVPRVWERWLRFDPIERLSVPEDRAALARLRSLHLTASRSDEWFLDVAARRFAQKAASHSVPAVHEEFDGGHFDRTPRFEAIFRRFAAVLPRTDLS